MKTNTTRLACVLSLSVCAFEVPNVAFAQAAPVVNVCTGLSVNLPVLTPTVGVVDGLLNGLLGTNVNLVGALSGQNIGVSVLDANGNLVSTPDCKLATNGITDSTNQGVTIGGGAINGLGGTTGDAPLAGSIDAIAIGNGATTSATATGAIALGLHGTVTGVNGVAIGNGATTSTTGGIALGSGSVANRAGMAGATEAFSGTAVTSTEGALSVGATGAERQITNVAGGTAATDAVNVRQLSAVNTTLSTELANALGGGSTYDSTTNVFTGPSYNLRGVVYNDVGSAIAALDSEIAGGGGGAIASNNAAGAPDATATGNNSTAVGFGSSASYNNSVAIGNGVATTRANQVSIGSGTNTYTMSGITSSASRAAQSGPTQVVTSDANGNLATANVDINQMSNDVSNLKSDMSDLRKEARGGIASAMAMAATPTPSGVGKTAWASNVATFAGRVAGSFSVAHRVDVDYPLIVNASVGYSPGTPAGVRLGVSGEF